MKTTPKMNVPNHRQLEGVSVQPERDESKFELSRQLPTRLIQSVSSLGWFSGHVQTLRSC